VQLGASNEQADGHADCFTLIAGVTAMIDFDFKLSPHSSFLDYPYPVPVPKEYKYKQALEECYGKAYPQMRASGRGLKDTRRIVVVVMGSNEEITGSIARVSSGNGHIITVHGAKRGHPIQRAFQPGDTVHAEIGYSGQGHDRRVVLALGRSGEPFWLTPE
jgi:hypothetical protein